MSKIARKVAKIFGSTAVSGDIKQFGSLAAGTPLTASDPAVVQALSNWLTGWKGAVIGGNSPAIEDMNGMCFVFGYQLAYLMQAGIAEWDADTTYYIGSFASDGLGNIYASITDTNLNNALSVTTQWKKVTGTPTVQTKAVDYQVLAGDRLVRVSGTFNTTLPDATLVEGLDFVIKKTDSNATTATILFLSAQSADGLTSLTLTEQYSFYRFQSNGTTYDITGWG